MVNINALGIIFPNTYDELVPQLVKHRTMASVPFGGRYRLVDFTLSNMVNSGIYRVGILMKDKYQSLIDHVGNAKDWDLSRESARVCTCCRRSANRLREPTARSNRSIPFAAS